MLCVHLLLRDKNKRKQNQNTQIFLDSLEKGFNCDNLIGVHPIASDFFLLHNQYIYNPLQ